MNFKRYFSVFDRIGEGKVIQSQMAITGQTPVDVPRSNTRRLLHINFTLTISV